MRKLRMVSLCSGIGGADLAAESTGALEVVGQVEIDPFCRAVLAKYWPDVTRLHDIQEVQGDEFGQVDVLAAGIPCQGNSQAGKRKGSQDERNLWPETRRIIGHTHPRWIVVENVPGLLTVESGRLFSTILTDLVTLGYRVGWAVYGACEVGAPHRRERVFIVAYDDRHRLRLRTNSPQRQPQRGGTPNPGLDGTQEPLAKAQCSASQQRSSPPMQRRWHEETQQPGLGGGNMADTCSTRQQTSRTWQQAKASLQCRPDMAEANSPRGSLSAPGGDATKQITGRSGERIPNTDSQGLPWSGKQRGLRAEADETPAGIERGDCSQPLWRGPGTIESGVCRGADGLSAWMDGLGWPALPGQEQESWEPPRTISGRQPYRKQRLKALGNAIVPQQIYPLFYGIAVWEGRIPT